MKIKINIMTNFLITIIIVLLFSCGYNSTAEPDCSEQDSILLFFDDTITKTDSFELVIIYDESNKLNLSEDPEPFINEQDTNRRRGIFKKRIAPLVIDSTKIMRRDSIYKDLEETEDVLQNQQRKIDSLIIKKK